MQLSFAVVRLLYLSLENAQLTEVEDIVCVHTKRKLKLSKLKIHQRCRFFFCYLGSLFEDFMAAILFKMLNVFATVLIAILTNLHINMINLLGTCLQRLGLKRIIYNFNKLQCIY